MKVKCCDPKINEAKARELLASNGMNRTKIKVQVLIELSRAHSPISVADLHQGMGDASCDISTVFRTITQFKEKGLVRELSLGESFFRYEIVDQNQNISHHHHHVRCRDCGDIRLIEKCDLSAFEKSIAKLGYSNMEHFLEFTGVCSKCN